MKTRSPVSRVRFVVALLGFILVAPFFPAERVSASATAPRVAVIGDSITARYNDKAGNAKQAWWSIVGRNYGARMTIYAQSGSGFQRPGLRCTGNRFPDRLAALKKLPPKIVIVEGGRNDWARCTDHGMERTSNKRVKKAVDSFLTKLKKAVPPQTKIYVLGPPWGSKDTAHRGRITRIVKASAKKHHMTFIDTAGVFNKRRVVDGIHPNRAGSVALGKLVIRAIGPTLP